MPRYMQGPPFIDDAAMQVMLPSAAAGRRLFAACACIPAHNALASVR